MFKAFLICLVVAILSITGLATERPNNARVYSEGIIIAAAGYAAHTGGKYDKLYDSNRIVVEYADGRRQDYEISFAQATVSTVGSKWAAMRSPNDRGVVVSGWWKALEVFLIIIAVASCVFTVMLAIGAASEATDY